MVTVPSSPGLQSHPLNRAQPEEYKARAGTEPVIGHIKHNHRMLRNYLKGTLSDKVNTIMAATGFN